MQHFNKRKHKEMRFILEKKVKTKTLINDIINQIKKFKVVTTDKDFLEVV